MITYVVSCWMNFTVVKQRPLDKMIYKSRFVQIHGICGDGEIIANT